MRDDEPDDQHPPPDKAPGAARHAPDGRAATIDRLERLLAEERDKSARLRSTIDESVFKVETLEKSYAKQLADTRTRCATAERALADEKARLAALESTHEETLRVLATTRGELASVTAERDLFRKQLGRHDGRRTEISAPENSGSEPQDARLTIDDLLADWGTQRGKPPLREDNGHLDARVSAEGEPPPGDMIAPELLLPVDRDDE